MSTAEAAAAPAAAGDTTAAAPSSGPFTINTEPVEYVQYDGERQLQGIINLIAVDLSEPYSIFTYRYFILNWPKLCYLAVVPAKPADDDGPAREERIVGCIVCKQEAHRTTGAMRGYIAMLAVHHSMRKRGMGSKLVQLAVQGMHDNGCDEAVLETEVTNIGALRLYEGLGFVRDKRLQRYYLNGNDAFRARRPPPPCPATPLLLHARASPRALLLSRALLSRLAAHLLARRAEGMVRHATGGEPAA